MHQNYHFLKRLVGRLDDELKGLKLGLCFSQNKDELILGFTRNHREIYLRADLSNNRGIITVTPDFKRAQKNSVDLFEELLDLTVKGVQQHLNERSFQLTFEEGPVLIFKLFGRQSNILLFPPAADSPKLFKSKLSKDAELSLAEFDRPIDQSLEAFVTNEGDLRKSFPTLGPLVLKNLEQRGLYELGLKDRWKLVTEVIKELDSSPYYILMIEGKVRLGLFEWGDVLEAHDDPIACLNAFYRMKVSRDQLETERGNVIRNLEKRITRSGNYTVKARAKLEELSLRRNDQVADIIMANLHQITPGSSQVELHDFYNDAPITIKLNAKLSPQKNAEKYYDKSKNQGIEVKKLQASLQAKEQDLAEAESLLTQVRAITELKELRALVKQEKVVKKGEKELPYHQFEIDSYTVLVGRNAKSNDVLTLKHAHKNDLWFHARDVAGSHVVLKSKPGSKFPNTTIEKVAQIAAWFSKGKNFPLCPVIYTEKKYVRKPKGFAPGMVKLEREEVILVEPKAVSNS